MTARFTSLSYPQGKSTPQKYLGRYFKKYSFFVGEIVLDEITRKHGELLKLIRFEELVNITKRYDYSALLSIIGDKIFEKGEYECMAIAYHIYKKSELHSVILDDKSARRFIKRNIPELYMFVKYSLRFLVNCYLERKIAKNKVVFVLGKVKQAIRNGGRPFNLGKRNIVIVDQLLNEVEND